MRATNIPALARCDPRALKNTGSFRLPLPSNRACVAPVSATVLVSGRRCNYEYVTRLSGGTRGLDLPRAALATEAPCLHGFSSTV